MGEQLEEGLLWEDHHPLDDEEAEENHSPLPYHNDFPSEVRTGNDFYNDFVFADQPEATKPGPSGHYEDEAYEDIAHDDFVQQHPPQSTEQDYLFEDEEEAEEPFVRRDEAGDEAGPYYDEHYDSEDHADLLEQEEMIEEEHVEIHDPDYIPGEYGVVDDREQLFTEYPKRKGTKELTIVNCAICGVVLRHPSKIKAHMRTHTGERPFKCDICGKTFTQRTPWRMHVKRHNNDLPFACHSCGKCFPNMSTLKAHQLRHSGKTRQGAPRPHLKPRKIHFEYVEAAGFMRIERSQPVVEADIVEMPPPPPMTALQIKRLKDVIDSVASNKSPKGTTKSRKRPNRQPPTIAQCSICGLMLKHRSRIEHHMNTHRGIKNFPCPHCDLHCSSLYSLRIHIRRKHEPDGRSIPCSWECGKNFVSMAAMNEHARVVHAGIKRYDCPSCRRLFTRRYHLLQHRLKDHPGFVPIDEYGDDPSAMEILQYLTEEGVHVQETPEVMSIERESRRNEKEREATKRKETPNPVVEQPTSTERVSGDESEPMEEPPVLVAQAAKARPSTRLLPAIMRKRRTATTE